MPKKKRKTYESLHDRLSEMIESGRLTVSHIPHDYRWLVETLDELASSGSGEQQPDYKGALERLHDTVEAFNDALDCSTEVDELRKSEVFDNAEDDLTFAMTKAEEVLEDCKTRQLREANARMMAALELIQSYLSTPQVQEWINRSGFKTDDYGKAFIGCKAALEFAKKVRS